MIFKLAPPVLVSVTVWAPLVVPTSCKPKLRLPGDSETAAGVTPVPLRGTLKLVLFALLITRLPLRGPVAVGVNEMLNVHAVPPGTPEEGHVFVCAKSPVI